MSMRDSSNRSCSDIASSWKFTWKPDVFVFLSSGHLEKVPVIVFSTSNHPDLVIIKGVDQANEPTRLCAVLLGHSWNVSNEDRVENLGMESCTNR